MHATTTFPERPRTFIGGREQYTALGNVLLPNLLSSRQDNLNAATRRRIIEIERVLLKLQAFNARYPQVEPSEQSSQRLSELTLPLVYVYS
jgi:hypothetical protein